MQAAYIILNLTRPGRGGARCMKDSHGVLPPADPGMKVLYAASPSNPSIVRRLYYTPHPAAAVH